MSNVSRSRRGRQPDAFRIVFHIGEDRYGVRPLAAHADVAVKAFRLTKHTGGREVYDVRLSAQGWCECDCPGHQRWAERGTVCKHVRALAAAGMLPVPTPAPRGDAQEFIEVLSEAEEAEAMRAIDQAEGVALEAIDKAKGAIAEASGWTWDTRVTLAGDGVRVSDAELAEAMEHAPEMPQPTEEEVNQMAEYFCQD
jgi:hypothetical protein